MSGKWTPGSAKFRTREAHRRSLAQAWQDEGMGQLWAEALADAELSEAEARGAAEQRRKDAELPEVLEALVERFGHDVFTMPEEDRDLMTRAAAVLAKAKGERA